MIVVRPKNPNHAAIPVILLYFTEGPCWPLIFSLGLRGQGRRTKRAAAFITMGGSGPAFFPFVMYAIIKRSNSVQLAYVVVALLQFLTGVYPLFLMLVRDARAMVDPVVGGDDMDDGDDERGSGGSRGSGSGGSRGSGGGNRNSNDEEEGENGNEENNVNDNNNNNNKSNTNNSGGEDEERAVSRQLQEGRRSKSRQSVTWAPGDMVAEYLRRLPEGFRKGSVATTADSTTTAGSSSPKEKEREGERNAPVVY
jgi:hypothetical protein